MSTDSRTYSDRKEYIKAAVKKHRKVYKAKAVAHLGGACSVCGYSRCLEALEFHHKDPGKKDFGISSVTRAWKTVLEELGKCILLCSNCHREHHAGVST